LSRFTFFRSSLEDSNSLFLNQPAQKEQLRRVIFQFLALQKSKQRVT
jgi:hypothetical protein